MSKLERLDVNNNQIFSLPITLGKLKNLLILHAAENHLEELPEEIGRLTRLQQLDLHRNQLKSLPGTIGRLSELRSLECSQNALSSLPREIGSLSALRHLDLSNNRLSELPVELWSLTNLESLNLSNNNLRLIPADILGLRSLRVIQLSRNPLPRAMLDASTRGVDSLKSYLLSVSDPEEVEELYEAKLLLVGEGKVGKSSLMAALRGEGFQRDRVTTHGTQINGLQISDKSTTKPLLLNVWDFGGQIIYRITNQFFFSGRAIYLLLWDPRQDVERCDVEGWIRRIRLRVGTTARIIIVASHARTGHRLAHLDIAVLKERYGEIIAGFCEIDSGVTSDGAVHVAEGDASEKFGIESLKDLIATTARQLPQMGMKMNRRWKAAYEDTLELRDEGRGMPFIQFSEFQSICKKRRLDEIAADTLAGLLHDLGHILHFGDQEGLRSIVVLQPEWVTKAIGFVLEDRLTNELLGVLEHKRLREIWLSHGIPEREVYPESVHPFFLRLMEHFDISYRIEGANADLVAQLVPESRPTLNLPWLPGSNLPTTAKQTTLICSMEEAPPGLIPWMICRTHLYSGSERLHWRGGMFLRRGGTDQALLEQDGRNLRITVRAPWPDYFSSVLRSIVERLIHERWPYLRERHKFSVPCPGTFGRGCDGQFVVDSLWEFRAQGDEEIRCQECRAKHAISKLLTGFESPATAVAEELDRIISNRLREGVSDAVSALDSRIQRAVMILLQGIGAESLSGPRLFSILPAAYGVVDPRKAYSNRFRINCWCEMPDHQHPTCPIGSDGSGEHIIDVPKDWFRTALPYLRLMTSLMKALIPVAQAAGAVILPDANGMLDRIDLMTGAGEAVIGEVDGSIEAVEAAAEAPELRWRREAATGEALRAVQGIISDVARKAGVDPWGGLRRVPTPTGQFLWLCDKHYSVYEPPPPALTTSGWADEKGLVDTAHFSGNRKRGHN